MAAGPVLLKAYVDKKVLIAFCVVGIVISIAITAVRYHVRLRRHKRLLSDDYAHLAAVIFYCSLCGMYIGDAGPMYRFIAFTSGEAPPTAHLSTDFAGMMYYNFAVTSFFWAVLWAVKLNLLLLFWKLLRDTGKKLWWWIVFLFTILTFIGCIITEAFSCDNYHDFVTLGACTSATNTRNQLISLYFATATDIITEIFVLSIPLQLLPKLRKSKYEKARLASLFGVGIITIFVSLVRVLAIYFKTGNATPSPPWLGFWAIIEGLAAIIVGSIPSISQMFRKNQSGYGDGYGSDKRGSTQYGQASRQRASMATNPRASVHTNPRASVLSNPRASLYKMHHPLDNISLSSEEDLAIAAKDSKDDAPPSSEEKPPTLNEVSIERQIIIEKRPDSQDVDDDFSRWMLSRGMPKRESMTVTVPEEKHEDAK